jgi:hypothetical protein
MFDQNAGTQTSLRIQLSKAAPAQISPQALRVSFEPMFCCQ